MKMLFQILFHGRDGLYPFNIILCQPRGSSMEYSHLGHQCHPPTKRGQGVQEGQEIGREHV